MKPSNELNTIFEVTGHFYQTKICGVQEKCRSLLEIKRKNRTTDSSDLLIIMMNPGSSKPIEENNVSHWVIGTPKKLIPTLPDTTQYQIMRVMDKVGLNYAKIINLSDLRTSKSAVFYQKVATYSTDHSHSIFDDTREREIIELLKLDIPIVCAWGLSRDLLPLVNLVSPKLVRYPIHGLKGNEEDFLFRHPLPQRWNLQKEWIEKICSQLLITKAAVDE